MNIKLNFKKILILSLFVLIGTLQTPVFATKLPQDVWNFIKSSLPDAKQRFDSVITLNNGIMYIPLYPPSDTTVEDIKIEYTYPQNMSLSSLPEVVLLNNGYSLLKVFKDSTGNFTLTKQDELPIKVRLGLMPQDMLTPAGLKMPESLKLTLGDLLIPSKDESSLTLNEEEKAKAKSPFNPVVKRDEFISINELDGKKIFINPKNSKFLEVYDKTSRTPLYELKLSSMPQKIITSAGSGVALALYWNDKKADIIDLKNENIITTIEFDDKADDAAYSEKEDTVYITSEKERKIYVVSLNSMSLQKVIKLEQRPSLIAYNSVDKSITFFDEYTSKIYNVTENKDGYLVQPLGTVPNVSKIETDTANVYAISRTQSQVYVFDKTQAKLIDTIDIDSKPVDAYLHNTRLYILCSKASKINVYDTVVGKVISRDEIPNDNFYSKITLIPNKNLFLITGSNSGNYILYNPDKLQTVKKQESYVNVSNIVILDKEQSL